MALTGQTGSVDWVVITSDDLYNRMAGPQVDAIAAAALANGQDGATGVFDAVMPDVARRVRQYIASNPKNRLSQTESSVPPECKGMLVWLCLRELMARLAIALELRPDQKAILAEAQQDLDKMRLMLPPWLVVSYPTDPEPNPELTAGVNATVVNSSFRQFTQCSLRSL